MSKGKKEVELVHGKGQNGLFFCEIKVIAYPYSSALAYGETPEEAEKNAWELRRMILEEQLKTVSKPIIVNMQS